MINSFKAFKTNVQIVCSPAIRSLVSSKSFLQSKTRMTMTMTTSTSNPNKKDWYVCMQLEEKHDLGRRQRVSTLSCVNISKLASSRPQLQRFRLFPAPPYFPRLEKNDLFFKNPVPGNNTVHRLDYNAACFCDFLTTVDAKVYFMLRDKEATTFQAYDPSHGSWKTLPPLPDSDYDYFCSNFVLLGRRMIGVCDLDNLTLLDPSTKSYVFDTLHEKWFVPSVALPPLVCAVEFSGFLIGVSCDGGYKHRRMSIVAYKIDEHNGGLPDPYSKHILDDDLGELFHPPLMAYGSSLRRFGDDKIVLVSAAEDINMRRLLVVAVFRVSISTQVVSDIPVINATLEGKQVYNLALKEFRNVDSTFLMQNAPTHLTHVCNTSFEQEQPLQENQLVLEVMQQKEEEVVHVQDDGTVVEWDEQIKDKSLYMCFAETRIDASVSYVIKAVKFGDLVSNINPKLHQRASTSSSGCTHLPRHPSCGLFGSLILFAGDSLIISEKDPYLEAMGRKVDIEVAQHAPISKDMYCYDMTTMSTDEEAIKRFPISFKGMKPQPILAQMGGKLYALAGSPMPNKHMNTGPCFEVFDPVEKQWSPLPDPPSYTKYRSLGNYHAIAGTNLLSWCGGYVDGVRSRLSPGVFRFDMAADDHRVWRLVNNSRVLTDDERWFRYDDVAAGSSILVDSGDGGDFVRFRYQNSCENAIRVQFISREFDNVVCLPKLKLPESVLCLLKPAGLNIGDRSSFVHLGGRRVCLLVSSQFFGPYSRTLSQLGEVDKMSIVVLVFEFQVSENRESVAAEFVFHQVLDCFDTHNIDARREPKTSDAHMVGAFLV